MLKSFVHVAQYVPQRYAAQLFQQYLLLHHSLTQSLAATTCGCLIPCQSVEPAQQVLKIDCSTPGDFWKAHKALAKVNKQLKVSC